MPLPLPLPLPCDGLAQPLPKAGLVENVVSPDLGGELAGDSLQQKFKALETGTGSDLALAELKAKMGLGPMPTQAALPAGDGASGAPSGDAAARGSKS